eukprot:TRINITY_DN14869_c0_g1_i1.p1 TRINITY_DN14869_c0_g1~~TRINITY_DN14869_c0_g1_i1.p1  ORF type:complete len:305 (+),score=77.70 TRINITY_DN14869_c0_g1_i1:147-1061(+)
MLTEEQLLSFERDGYLVIEQFVAQPQLDKLKSRANAIVDDFDPASAVSIFTTGDEQVKTADDYFLESGDKVRCFFEEGAFEDGGGDAGTGGSDVGGDVKQRKLKQAKALSINKIGHALHDLDPVFSEFCRSQNVKETLSAIGFKDPLLTQSMYIFKQPNIGGRVAPHQDHTFLATDPPSVVGMWFAVEEACVDNACLWAIPGSHKTAVNRQFVRSVDDKGSVTMTFRGEALTFEDSDFTTPLVAKPGTLVILHGGLVHMSHPNTSTRSRHAFTMHIVENEKCKWSPENWLQRPDSLPFRGFESA